ncbi:MAG: PHP domain-containing protein, partial [Thermodesulfobacteriota bacterium]
MRADLHLHSRYSDGWDWPAGVGARAAAAGLELVALADHESMEGVGEFLEACGRLGLAAVPAAEVDCTAPELGFDGEILVYFPGGRFGGMAAFLRGRLREREERMGRLVGRARELYGAGAPTFEELGRFKAGGQDPGARLLAYAVVDLFECLKSRGVVPPRADYRGFKAALTGGDAQPKPHARYVIARARAEG